MPCIEREYPYPNGGSDYLEVQIWGPLTVDDVREFLVPPNIGQTMLRKLIDTGLPIYEYEETRTPNPRRVKGKLLSAGVSH